MSWSPVLPESSARLSYMCSFSSVSGGVLFLCLSYLSFPVKTWLYHYSLHFCTMGLCKPLITRWRHRVSVISVEHIYLPFLPFYIYLYIYLYDINIQLTIRKLNIFLILQMFQCKLCLNAIKITVESDQCPPFER